MGPMTGEQVGGSLGRPYRIDTLHVAADLPSVSAWRYVLGFEGQQLTVQVAAESVVGWRLDDPYRRIRR